jgi:hypothetical protein
MRERKIYKKIKNTIIAGAGTGIVAGMFLVGGMNTVYAETVNKVIPVYTYKKALSRDVEYKQTDKKEHKKNTLRGWRRNQA